jgi:hypothetical protein
MDNWIDLTREKFAPVLTFTSEGHYAPFLNGIERETHGMVVSLAPQPIEKITVGYSVQFKPAGIEMDTIIQRMDRVVYVRGPNGKFEPDVSLSTATHEDIRDFYDITDDDLEVGAEKFLKFNLKGLSAIAKGKDNAGRLWLTEYLQRSPDTPESRQLKSLLSTQK